MSNERFTAIDNRTLQDERLSYGALGLLVFLLTRPDDYRVDPRSLAEATSDSLEMTLAALSELVDLGYVIRREDRDPKGRVWVSVYVGEVPGLVPSEL
jgi:hypothetical protein